VVGAVRGRLVGARPCVARARSRHGVPTGTLPWFAGGNCEGGRWPPYDARHLLIRFIEHDFYSDRVPH